MSCIAFDLLVDHMIDVCRAYREEEAKIAVWIG